MSRAVPQLPATSPRGSFQRHTIVLGKAPGLQQVEQHQLATSSAPGTLSTVTTAEDLPCVPRGGAVWEAGAPEPSEDSSDSSDTMDDERSFSDGPAHDESFPFSAADELVAQTAICFDWDDTLFPTHFITKVVEPWMRERHVQSLKDTPFFELLSQQARCIADVIRMASSVGRVFIVTLACKDWLEDCVDLYLPGLDLHELLTALCIPVFYARDFLKKRIVTAADGEGGVDLQSVAKMRAMTKALQKLSASGLDMTNWISIGDSSAERDALTEYAWSRDEDTEQKILCKTVKFMRRPSMEELDAELNVLLALLPQVVFSPKDQDIVVQDDWIA